MNLKKQFFIILGFLVLSGALLTLGSHVYAQDSPQDELAQIEKKAEQTKEALAETKEEAQAAKEQADQLLSEKEDLETEASIKAKEAQLAKKELEIIKEEARNGDKDAKAKQKVLESEAQQLEEESKRLAQKSELLEEKARLAEETALNQEEKMRKLKERFERLLVEKKAKRSWVNKSTDAGIIFGIGAFLFLILKLGVNRINHLITRTQGNKLYEDDATQRIRTFAHLVNWVGSIVIVLVVFYMVLENFGFNLTPLLAGAGIIGLSFGFGGQYLIRDIISGIFILFEGQYHINDVVKIGDLAGLVESVNLRVTILRDLEGRVIYIPNGEIKSVKTTAGIMGTWEDSSPIIASIAIRASLAAL